MSEGGLERPQSTPHRAVLVEDLGPHKGAKDHPDDKANDRNDGGRSTPWMPLIPRDTAEDDSQWTQNNGKEKKRQNSTDKTCCCQPTAISTAATSSSRLVETAPALWAETLLCI